MLGRRRPLARAAVVGGAAYYAGKKHAEGQAADAEAEQYEEEAPAEAPAEPAPDPMEQLQKLGELHNQGVLTDAEFEIQKTKILQQM